MNLNTLQSIWHTMAYFGQPWEHFSQWKLLLVQHFKEKQVVHFIIGAGRDSACLQTIFSFQRLLKFAISENRWPEFHCWNCFNTRCKTFFAVIAPYFFAIKLVSSFLKFYGNQLQRFERSLQKEYKTSKEGKLTEEYP